MKEVMWKRTRAKKPLFNLLNADEKTMFLYKEVEDKIYIRCAHHLITIKKSEFKTHLNPVITNNKIEEVSPELSNYLDDVHLKKKK
jgi:hypothetical protein